MVKSDKKTGVVAKRSRNRSLRAVPRKVPRREKGPPDNQQEEGDRALPVVLRGANSPSFPVRSSARCKKELYGTTANIRGEHLKHPMDDFDDLLDAFDGFIGSANMTGADLPVTSYALPQTFGNSRPLKTPVNPISRDMPDQFTKGCDNTLLPRLHSPFLAGYTAHSLPRFTAKLRHGISYDDNAQTFAASPPIYINPMPPCVERRPCRDILHEDPLNLMLRSKYRGKSKLKGSNLVRNMTEPLLFELEGTEMARQDDLSFSRGGPTSLGGGSVTEAGIFRISHPGAGIVYYGSSWDIAGAKEDQLRQLRCRNDSEVGVHPHKGLSAVVQGKTTDDQGAGGTPKEIKRWDEGSIHFEVVRRIPLPTRFRASDFEEMLREACTRELWLRQVGLLVRMARQYQRKKCGPAFRHILTVCRLQAYAEINAAVVQVQSVWRGLRGRFTAQLKQEMQGEMYLRSRQANVSAIVALWTQARYRGHAGRRKVGEEKKVMKLLAKRKRLPGGPATTLWQRSSSQREGKAANVHANGKEIKGDPSEEIQSEEDETISSDDVPIAGNLLAGIVRGPPRPISASEVRVAEHLCGPDTGTLPSEESNCSALEHPTWGKSRRPSDEHQLSQRPSLFREARASSNKMEGVGAPINGEGSTDMKIKYNKSDDFTGDASSFDIRPLSTFTPAAPDASRLVFDGDPLSASATTIQAGWRGFISRLEGRKRRRVAAALRRKREGKWRQQRGVIGKQVPVGWDERRGLQEGFEGYDGGRRPRGGAPCIDIQRVWRGALGRRKVHAIRRHGRKEMEASVRIQRVYRGAMGRRQAKKAAAGRQDRIVPVYQITRQIRYATELTAAFHKFLKCIRARRWRRDQAATVIQCAARSLAGRHRAQFTRRLQRESRAAQKVQISARGWIGRRRAWQRTVLNKMGVCALCCTRLAAMYFEATEQELCLECYWRTAIVLENRRLTSASSTGAFELVVHNERKRAATLTQRAWVKFQQRASAKYGACEVCPRWGGVGTPRPRAARAVCIGGCDCRRHVRFCRRCSAIAHFLRATAGHEIRSVDQYGTEMAAAATLGGAIWRYSMKLKFWKLFSAHRCTINSAAALVQSRWRCYRYRSIFSALRRGFLYVEAAARHVEQYWCVAGHREVIMASIAGFLAYNVQALPPGIHPAPSGVLALWEIILTDTVKCRAIEMIQKVWRDKMMRVVAKVQVGMAQKERIKRQRQRILAGIHASVRIQQGWRGCRGRAIANDRQTTIAFARATANSYTNPGRFAIANLHEFNTHRGILGSAGVNARSLLAVAANGGGESQGLAAQYSRGRVRLKGKRSKGQETIRLRLEQSTGEWGLAESRVAGITEISLSIRLWRCASLLNARLSEAEAAVLAAEKSELEAGGLNKASKSTIGFRENALTPWIEREASCFEYSTPKESHLDKKSCRECANENPPLTLKLELISVQSREFSEDQHDSTMVSDDDGPLLFHPATGYSTSRKHHEGNRSGSNTRSRTSDSTSCSSDTRSTNSSTSDKGNSDNNRRSNINSSPDSNSSSNSRFVASRDHPKRSIHVQDKINDRVHDQHQCQVQWCGEDVGGTCAPLTGFPAPRWEGQVFYLPLYAASYHTKTPSAKTLAVTQTGEDNMRRFTNPQRWREGSPKRQYRGREADPDLLPPLLIVNLNRLSVLRGSRRLYQGAVDITLNGEKEDIQCRSTISGAGAQAVPPWSAYVSGKIEPETVGRVVLEAGDVLGMLGSQQIVKVSAIYPGRLAGGDESLALSSSSSSLSSEGKEKKKSEPGWHLRLLLSLEDRERTRTRLLVTETVSGIISHIIDAIPGKVARIELRVIGTRTLSTSSSSAVARQTTDSQLCVSAEWNGDHAAFFELPSFDINAICPSTPDVSATQDDSDGIGYAGCRFDGNADNQVNRRPNLAVLPMYVPLVMRTPTTKGSSDTPFRNGGKECNRRKSYHDDCGVTHARDGPEDDCRDVEGGRSHCLRLTVGIDAALNSASMNPGGFEQGCSGWGGKVVTPPLAVPVPRLLQETETTFFEWDLLRNEWADILIPFSIHDRSALLTRNISTDNIKGRRRRCRSAMQDPTLRGQSRQTQKRRSRLKKPLEMAVVLQARSAGFNPKNPPFWLIRRDFAERTVRRIILAAAASVLQPRVEVTLLGLRGAVDSLLLVGASKKQDSPINNHQKEAPLPTKNEGNLDTSFEDIFCQAFWNDALVHQVRLCPVGPFHDSLSLPLVLHETACSPSNRKSTSNLNPMCNLTDKEVGHEMLLAHRAAVDDDANTDKGYAFDRKVDNTRLKDRSTAEYPTKLFYEEGNNNSCLPDNWVDLGGTGPSNFLVEMREKTKQRALHNGAFLSEEHDDSSNKKIFSPTGRGRKKESTGEERQPPTLAWVPTKGNLYDGQPIRFFLPNYLSNNAAGRRAKTSSHGDSDRVDDIGESSSSQGRGSRNDATAGECATQDNQNLGSLNTGKIHIRGDMRLLFWGVSAPVPGRSGWDVNETEGLRGGSDKKSMMATIDRRQRRMEEGRYRKLLGCARLVDDELLLQPAGQRVDLALRRNAGLDMSTAWAMTHTRGRKVDAYRVTHASVAVVIRHFDVPREPILGLQCPAPFLEVEVIDGHRLRTASGQLNTNPYVVLTINGDVFARSATARGTTRPVWSSEIFRVKLPPPLTGEWHRNEQEYFQGYSGEPCTLDARVYSQADPLVSGKSVTPKQQYLHGGVGEGDVPLGQSEVPFSLLKSLPFHYLPLRLSPLLHSGCRCTAAVLLSPPGGCKRNNHHDSSCQLIGGCGVISKRNTMDDKTGDFGLLGIGLRMVFPDPTIPELPPFSNSASVVGVSRTPLVQGSADGIRGVTGRATARHEVVLRVHEAEGLVALNRPKNSLNPYCLIRVEDVEIGRTITVPNTCDPVWAAEFNLFDEILGINPLKNGGGGRGGARSTRKPSPLEKKIRVHLEVWNCAPEGEPVVIGATELPPDLLRALLSPDDARGSKIDGGQEGGCMNAKKKPLLLNLSLRTRIEEQPVGDRIIGSGEVAATAVLHGSYGSGVLSVSLERILRKATSNFDAKAGIVQGKEKKRDSAKDEALGSAVSAMEKGSVVGDEMLMAGMKISEGSLQRAQALRVQHFAKTTRGAQVRLEEARAMVRDLGSAPRSSDSDDCARINAERYARAWSREVERAEGVELLAAVPPDGDGRKDSMYKINVGAEWATNRARSADPSNRGRRKVQRTKTMASTVRKSSRHGKAKPGGGSKQPRSTVSCIEATSGAIKNEPTTAAADHSNQEEAEIIKTGAFGETGRGEGNGLQVAFDSEEFQEQGELREDTEEPSALERILPHLPAARREIFLQIEAVLGLMQPFATKGSNVSARVFWNGQEVGRTKGSLPSLKAPSTPRTSVATAENPMQSDEAESHGVGGGGIMGKMRGTAISVVDAVSDLALTVGSGEGGIVESRWEHETFILPLPDSEGDTVQEDDAGSRSDGEGGCLNNIDPSELTKESNQDDAQDQSIDSYSDIHLRIEIWQGHHCHGQVELEGSELMRLSKVVQNATADRCGDFTVECGSGEVRLPDHFPHFLPTPEACNPYKLLVVPRDGEAHRRDSANPPSARLAMNMFVIEPGQAVAVQGQLAVALKATGCSSLKPQQGEDRNTSRNGGSGESEEGRRAFGEENGIIETLIEVLTIPSSPLAFRIQPLVLRLNTLDGCKEMLTELGKSNLVLLARREVVVISKGPPSVSDAEWAANDADRKKRGSTAAVTTTSTSEGDHWALSERRQVGTVGERDNLTVVEEEELGRSRPFRIHSDTTIFSVSFTVPAKSVVSDVRRRTNKSEGGSGLVVVDGKMGTPGSEQVERTILELVRDDVIDDCQLGPSLMGKVASLKKGKVSSESTGDDIVGVNSGDSVVACATLDASFLRRTIGSKRSVMMKVPTALEREGGEGEGSTSNQLPSFIGMLEIAGHVVRASPARPRFRLQVLECQNLRVVDVLVKSDPCVIVFWNNVEIGRTWVIRDDLNPVFSATRSTFELPLAPLTATHGRSNSSAYSQRRSGQQRFFDWQNYNPELRLEVWDMDRDFLRKNWKKGKILGLASLCGPCDLVPVVKAVYMKHMGAAGVMLRLRAGSHHPKHESTVHASTQPFSGVISIKISIESATSDTEAWMARACQTEKNKANFEQGKKTVGTALTDLDLSAADVSQVGNAKEGSIHQPHIGVRCLDARGLPLKCDAYCRVFWNGRQVGSTLPASCVARTIQSIASNNPPSSAFQRNPVWWVPSTAVTTDDGHRRHGTSFESGLTAIVPLHENPIGDELTLDVFDGSHQRQDKSIDGEGCKDNASYRRVLGRHLGSVTVRGEYLSSLSRGRINLPLFSFSSSGKNAQMTLSLSIARLPNDQQPLHAVVRVPQQQNIQMDSKAAAAGTCTKREGGRIPKEQSQPPKRWLRLLLEGARLLRGLDVSGTSDPFCIVYVNRIWYRETRVCWGTLAPRWDESIEVEIFGRGAAIELEWDHEVRLEVWDKDAVGADDFIGETTFFLHEERDGSIETRTDTRLRPEKQTREDDQDQVQPCSQRKTKRGMQQHLLELHQEGSKDTSRVDRLGGISIGTLSCATLVYTEENWKTEVEKINQPWALGSPDSSSVPKELSLMVQLVGVALLSGKKLYPSLSTSDRVPICFAVLYWNGKVVGQTPPCRDLQEATWREQTFALRMDTKTHEDALEIEIYFAGVGSHRASGEASSSPRNHTTCSLVARCRLEGPFSCEMFPAYSSNYPLLPGQTPVTSAKRKSTKEDASGKDGMVTAETGIDIAAEAKKVPGATSSQLIFSPTPQHVNFSNIDDDNNTTHNNHQAERVAKAKQPKRSSVHVGYLKMRVGIATTTVRVAEKAAIGDEDAPEIRRRRKNTVKRRLRLWVRWISLTHLIDFASEILNPKKTPMEGKNGCELVAETDESGRRQSQKVDRHQTKHGGVGKKMPADTTGSIRCSSRVQTSGVSCVVSWCGVEVTSFEICPQTGVPLTPGECLLALPRGMEWRTCRLVVEVVATEQFMKHRGMEHAREQHWHLGCNDLRDGGDNTSQGKREESETGNIYDRFVAKDQGQYLLGMVVVSWQTLKALEEHAYRFTLCPEGAVPEKDYLQRGGGCLNLESALCIPTTTLRHPTNIFTDFPTPYPLESSNSHGAVNGVTNLIPDTDNVAVSKAVDSCGTWRIIPARLALSLRLERLEPSWPPCLSRVPAMAPPATVCRLRLGVLGGGSSIRTLHPSLLPPHRSAQESSTIKVIWNGYRETVGPSSEWRVEVPSIYDAASSASHSTNDFLLPIPRNARERLILTLIAMRSPTQDKNDGNKNPKQTPSMLGSVSINWGSLSCLPSCTTNYFVDAQERQWSTTKDPSIGAMTVDLELRASSLLRSPAVQTSLLAHQALTSTKYEVGVCGDINMVELIRVQEQNLNDIVSECCRTAGFDIRVKLQLEQSPVSIPHVLSVSPIAARASPSAETQVPLSVLSLGDFRNPCLMERVPCVRFSWPWDNYWLALVERRTSLAPRRPWHFGSRRATSWRKPRRTKTRTDTGTVSVRLPLVLSGLDGSVGWPGCEKLGKGATNSVTESTAGLCRFKSGEVTHKHEQQPPVVFVEVFDMGSYAPLEQQAARSIQRLWRRALEALQDCRLWWKHDAIVRRYNAATCIQAHYRGLKDRVRAKVSKQEGLRKNEAAATIQRRWRFWRVRCRAKELRAAISRELLDSRRLEEELEAKCLESRRAGLSVLVTRGASLQGMDLLGLGDPFCVVLWNGTEVGRTVVRHGTRYPDWVLSGGTHVRRSMEGEGWLELPFYIPKAETWGIELWSPMELEIRCYDHDFMGPPDLIGHVKLGTDAILGMVHMVADANEDGLETTAAAITWLELLPGVDDKKGTITGGNGRKERNPFDSLGDIAVTVKTRLPLPKSLDVYGRLKDEEGGDHLARSAADAGVWAVLVGVQRALCLRDRGLWVVSASGLCKTDFFGRSDPYAKVFWDGREIGTTVVRRKTLNPVWVVEANKGTAGYKRSSNGTSNIKQHKTAASVAEEDQPYFWLESVSSVNPRLRVELYDWDAVGSHDFLGGVELSLEEIVDLQRITLGKAKMSGGKTDQQILLKTEYPLRSRDNQVGKNGTIGLCVYLDLENQKRVRRREQAEAARKQMAIDQAIAEDDMEAEAAERTKMAAEDSDVSENKLYNHQQEESPWQMYYDESSNPPVPWWFNPETGESTWECPSAETGEKSLLIRSEEHCETKHQQIVIARGEEGEWQMYYDYIDESPDAPVPWWYNSVTGESTWECPTAMVAACPEGTRDRQDEQMQQQLQQGVLVASVDEMAVGGISSPCWAQYWCDEGQAYYYVNEATQETSWDPPFLPQEEAEAPTFDIHGGGCGTPTIVEHTQSQALVAPTDHTSATDAEQRFPFYINERGNRVFCVPRKHPP